jgi:hypothetical protein
VLFLIRYGPRREQGKERLLISALRHDDLGRRNIAV